MEPEWRWCQNGNRTRSRGSAWGGGECARRLIPGESSLCGSAPGWRERSPEVAGAGVGAGRREGAPLSCQTLGSRAGTRASQGSRFSEATEVPKSPSATLRGSAGAMRVRVQVNTGPAAVGSSGQLGAGGTRSHNSRATAPLQGWHPARQGVLGAWKGERPRLLGELW